MISLPGRITIDSSFCGGRPFYRNTRIPVYVVLEMLANHESWEDIHEAYPDLVEDDLKSALDYSRDLASIPRQKTVV